jgi:pimeloyl-ACP methyl ester carboxylesterase
VSAVSNDPVLLLHGQPGAAADWERLRASIGNGVRTIAIDRPGWDGRSAATDLGGNASAAIAALDRAGVDRATVVGHSLGAAVAAWLACAEPDRVGRLVLVSPAANVDSLTRFDYLLGAPVLGPLAGAVAMATGGLVLANGSLRRAIGRAIALDDRYLADAARILRAPAAWRAFASEQRTLIRQLPLLEHRLGQLSAPTTIVAGTADRVVPIGAARRLATQVPGAELVEIEAAGHLVHLRHTDELAQVIAGAARV